MDETNTGTSQPQRQQQHGGHVWQDRLEERLLLVALLAWEPGR